MNIIYNSILQSDNHYSAAEMKLYSYYISSLATNHSLGYDQLAESFTQEQLIEDFDNNFWNEEYNMYIAELPTWLSNVKLAKKINVSEGTIRRIKNQWLNDGIITGDDQILFSKDVITAGYFHLAEVPELYKKPELHITYSLLVSLSKKTGGVCHTMRYKLAQMLNIEESNIIKQLHRLSQMGLVERTKNGLKVN